MMIKVYFTTILAAVFLSSVSALSQVTLTMGGDVNFNKNLMKPSAQGFIKDGVVNPWASYTKHLKPLIDGTLNFANIETVVSDRTDLVPQTKAFVFQTHPEAIKHLADIGFNLMNMANNHSYDFGAGGMQATLEAMNEIKTGYPQINYFGMGLKKDLLVPQIIKANGYSIAIASVSIIDKQFKATDTSVGLIHIWDTEQYREMMRNMRTTSAHYKILSIHFGTEGQVTLDAKQKEYYEYALKSGDVDLIIGHHPHAVRPIQKMGDKYIFYSLGNYFMLGSANITAKTDGADFGLFSKLHLVENEKGRLVPEAIELVPLTNTHSSVRPLPAEKAIDRLKGLQNLNDSQLGKDSFQFVVNSKGRGLYCLENLRLDSSQRACAQ